MAAPAVGERRVRLEPEKKHREISGPGPYGIRGSVPRLMEEIRRGQLTFSRTWIVVPQFPISDFRLIPGAGADRSGGSLFPPTR